MNDNFKLAVSQMTTLLDRISQEIKDLEFDLQSVPFECSVEIPGNDYKALKWGEFKGKKRLIFIYGSASNPQDDEEKPLIECKSEVRLEVAKYLSAFRIEVSEKIHELIEKHYGVKK